MFDEIVLPDAVFRELCAGSSVHQKELIEIKEYVSKGYLKIYKVKNAAMVKSMYGKLHFGELEVIVATKELGLHLAIIDEKAAQKMASEFLYDSFTNLFLIALNLRVHCIFASLPPAIFVSSGLIKISSKNVDQFFLPIIGWKSASGTKSQISTSSTSSLFDNKSYVLSSAIFLAFV